MRIFALRSLRFSVVTLSLSALAVPAANAAGDPTVYTSQTSFTSAVTGGTTITFENIAAPGGRVSYSANAPLKLNGVTFQGQSVETKNGRAKKTDNVSSVDSRDEASGQWRVDGTDSYLGGGTDTANPSDYYNGTVTLTFDQAYTAWGANIGTGRDTSQTVQISLYNGTTLITSTPTTLNLAYSPSSPQYIGFAGTQSFNKVVITGTAGTYTANPGSYVGSFTLLDNVRVGNSITVVPEPEAWVTGLSLAGMTSLGLVRGRRRMARRPAA